MPPLEETLVRPVWDEVVIDEMWSFIGCKACQAWIWLVVSRSSLQVVAFFVGARDLESAQALWQQVPSPWCDGLVFTDGFSVYPALFGDRPHKHCPCPKAEPGTWGETSIAEGTNNALRQRVSYLGRKSAAFARSLFWLNSRLRWFLHRYNLRQAKRWG